MLKKLLLALLLLTGRAEANSLSFNGSSDLARVSTAIVTAMPFTMCAWAYTTSLAANETIVSIATSTDTLNYYAIGLDTSGHGLAWKAITANTNVISSTTVTTNAWFEVCGVFISSTSFAVYLNGGGKTSAVNSGTPTGMNRTALGVRDASGNTSWWTGQIAQVVLWDVDIGDAAIATLAQGVSPLKIQPDRIKFFIPYLGVGSAVADWKGNNMTETGTSNSTNTPTQVRHP